MNIEATEQETSSIVWPVLLSGAIGAGLALLLTPKSGKDIRSDIANLARRAAEEPSETLQQAASTVSQAAESGKQALSGSSEELSESLSASNERSLVVPILISSVVGAAVALLFAPKPGTEMMDDIKDMASSAYDKSKSWYEQGASAVKEAMEKGKEAAVEQKEKIKSAA